MKTRLCPKAMVSTVAGFLFSPVLLFGQVDHTVSNTPSAHQTPETSGRPLPFKQVVERTTGHRVLTFDTNNAAHVALREKLFEAASLAGERALNEGLFAERPNDASRKMGAIVRATLRDVGLDSRAPGRGSHRPGPKGYPDLEILGNAPCYLEIKTYSASTEKGTESSFRYSPAPNRRITRDAVHFVLGFQLERSVQNGRQNYIPIRWRLISLEDMALDATTEFHQSNRHLYCEQNPHTLVAERPVR